METSFDFEPVGAVAAKATNTSSIEQKLDKIIAELTAIRENTETNKKEEVLPQVVEAVPEADEILKEVNSSDIVAEEDTLEKEPEEVMTDEFVPEAPIEEVSVESDTKEEPKEETLTDVPEETFTPVSVSNIDMDSVPAEQSITSIEDLLASVPQTVAEESKEPIVDNSDAKVEPEVVAQPIVEPTPAAVQPDPVIVPEPVPEPVPAPVVDPVTVSQPIVEPVAPVAAPVTPVEPVTSEATPQVEEPTMEFKPDVLVKEDNIPVQAVETPVVDNTKKYTVVTPLYAGMTDVKTGDKPHRVMPMQSNDVLLSKREAKTLINKAA